MVSESRMPWTATARTSSNLSKTSRVRSFLRLASRDKVNRSGGRVSMSRKEQVLYLRCQRGVAMVFVVAALAALLLMVGLALDVGHATLNKTRLQNATDAAALAAAKALDSTGSSVIATTEALT